MRRKEHDPLPSRNHGAATFLARAGAARGAWGSAGRGPNTGTHAGGKADHMPQAGIGQNAIGDCLKACSWNWHEYPSFTESPAATRVAKRTGKIAAACIKKGSANTLGVGVLP